MQRLTSLDTFFAKPFVHMNKGILEPDFEVLKKRDKGQKCQNPTRLTVSLSLFHEIILTPIAE